MNNSSITNSNIGNSNIREDIIKRIDKLPDKIQQILLSDELADYFLELDRQNHLNMEQFDAIVETTHQVFLGMINSSVFLPLLSGQLIDKGIHPVVAKEIAQKIESKFIAPFREDLEKIYRRFFTMEKLEKGVQEETQKEETAKPLEIGEEKVEKSVIQEEIKEKQETPSQLLIIGEEKSSEEMPQEILQKQIELQEMNTSFKPAQEEKPKRSFLSFLKFKKYDEKTEVGKTPEPVIIGKEEEFKPVLEEVSPWRISFEDVKPTKEKVVSEVELKHEDEIKPIGAIEKPIFEKEEIIQKDETSNIPAESISPMQAATPPSEGKPESSIFETKTFEPLREKEVVPGVMPPSEISKVKHEALNLTQNKPSVEEQTSASATIKESFQEQSEKIKEEISQNVPAENVIDLRKLKF
ncbi:MAG: hypothetical protein QXD43_03525 [Candidatus Aenigmatarchaeota archaeon]